MDREANASGVEEKKKKHNNSDNADENYLRVGIENETETTFMVLAAAFH